MSLKRACEVAVVAAGVAYPLNTENATPDSGNDSGADNAEICRVRRSPIVEQLQKSYRGFLLMRAWQTVDIEFKLLLRDADFKLFSAQAVEPYSVPRLIGAVISLDIGWRTEMKRLDLDTDDGKRMFAVMVRGYIDDMDNLLAEYDIM